VELAGVSLLTAGPTDGRTDGRICDVVIADATLEMRRSGRRDEVVEVLPLASRGTGRRVEIDCRTDERTDRTAVV